MNNHALLKRDNRFLVVQINPVAYNFEAFTGKPNKDAILSFNVNYSWLLLAIGHVRSDHKNWITLPDKKDIRPCLCIKDNGLASIRKPSHPDFDLEKFKLVMQGGPSLVANKKIVHKEAIAQEDFRSDAVRKTDHVAVGTTKLGKIIAIYGSDCTMLELAEMLLAAGAINGFKCDGGSKSCFNYNGIHKGQTSSCKAGIQFLKK